MNLIKNQKRQEKNEGRKLSQQRHKREGKNFKIKKKERTHTD